MFIDAVNTVSVWQHGSRLSYLITAIFSPFFLCSNYNASIRRVHLYSSFHNLLQLGPAKSRAMSQSPPPYTERSGEVYFIPGSNRLGTISTTSLTNGWISGQLPSYDEAVTIQGSQKGQPTETMKQVDPNESYSAEVQKS